MADLTVLINEKITLDGNDRGVLTTQTITGVNYIDNRTFTIPTGSVTTLFSLSDNNSAGTFITSSIQYIRLTNSSTTNTPVKLIVSSSTEAMSYLINTGSSYMMSTSKITGSFKYGRITNKSTVPIIVTINSRDVVNDTNYYSLNNVVEPGSSFCLSSTQVTSSIISSNFNFINDYIYEVLALPSGSSATIEYFIATT